MKGLFKSKITLPNLKNTMIKEFNTKSNFKAKSIVNKSSYFNFTSQLSKVRKNKVSLFQIIRLLAKLKYKNRQRTRYGLENKRSAFFSALIFTLIFEYTVGFEDSYKNLISNLINDEIINDYLDIENLIVEDDIDNSYMNNFMSFLTKKYQNLDSNDFFFQITKKEEEEVSIKDIDKNKSEEDEEKDKDKIKEESSKKKSDQFILPINKDTEKHKEKKNEENLSEIRESYEKVRSVQKFSKVSDFQIAKNMEERLDDVKGINEIKDEINEIVQMLKTPLTYEEAGAKLVRGILLMGKPGTGKTLLAKALAGESGVNFIYCNGADFEKTFVGEGSTSIKKLFNLARQNQPSIIFIDEIDSLLHKGRRSGKYSSSNDRSLINTFLSEMDGFNKRDYIFVLGATNSEKDLDKAATRPGRFDKLISVPLPDSKGREELFDFYLSKINLKLEEDVSSKFLSKLTSGFSGAEIENLVNHAVIDSVDNDKEQMDKLSFEEARDRVLTGIKLKIPKQTLKNILQTAVHESGHALTCLLDDICKQNMHKISIIPRGQSKSKSYSLSNDGVEGTKEEMLSFLDVALGGMFAEEIFFHDNNKIGEGCGNGDLNKATNIAKRMIKNYGMTGSEFGLQVINDDSYLVEHKISEITRDKLDKAVIDIINARSRSVKEKLELNSDKLKEISKNLIEYEELTKEDLVKLMDGNQLEGKLRKNKEVISLFQKVTSNIERI